MKLKRWRLAFLGSLTSLTLANFRWTSIFVFFFFVTFSVQYASCKSPITVSMHVTENLYDCIFDSSATSLLLRLLRYPMIRRFLVYYNFSLLVCFLLSFLSFFVVVSARQLQITKKQKKKLCPWNQLSRPFVQSYDRRTEVTSSQYDNCWEGFSYADRVQNAGEARLSLTALRDLKFVFQIHNKF